MPATQYKAKKNDADVYRQFFEACCRRCSSNRLVDNLRGEYVCTSCGLVQGAVFDDLPEWWEFKTKTYQRVFYFNERCARFACEEPRIDDDSWSVIHAAAVKYTENRNIERINREHINKILKSVTLTPEFMEKHRSQKFKRTKMTKKRFYDKFSEKWKTILWKLTNRRPKIPTGELIQQLKKMFGACQKPFELFRHAPNCDKRSNCDRYFDCWHNFINYDFIFRKLLQIAEIKFNFKGVYNSFKNEFPLVSKKIRDKKLRPIFKQICTYNNWPCPDDE